MIRISTIFVAVCMAMIAGSLGLALHAVADVSGQQSAIVALAALTFMILYNAVSMRMRDQPDVEGQIAGLSQGTAELARQVGDLGRRLAAIETRMVSGGSAAQDRLASVADEISELGTLVNQIAQSVAIHEDLLLSGSLASAADGEAPVVAVQRPAKPMVQTISPPRPAASPALADRIHIEVDSGRSPLGDPVLATLKDAINADRLDVYLQPIVTLPQRKVRFYEAVTRLRDDNGKMLSAENFITAAEDAGLMGGIDGAVMLRGVQVLRRLTVRNKDVGLFCNVAATTVSSQASFARCLDLLESNRDVASSLILEFKQGALRHFGAVERERLAALAQRGYRFSIDHVTDLRIEPRDLADRGVRYIKIPASLLLNQQKMSSSDIHAADFSRLLDRFGIDLIAERIEGERAAVDLLDYGVRFGQGFLFAAPRPLRPDNAQAANVTSPQPPAGKDPLEVPQHINGADKLSKTRAGVIEPQTITGNAALARRIVRQT